MNDTTKLVRIVSGITAIAAGVLMIVVANMIIAQYVPIFAESTRTRALSIIAYFLIAVAIISKLCSVVLMAGKLHKSMAFGIIVTQLTLIALEIATMVLWTNMSMTVRVLDYIFLVISAISILLSIVYLVRSAHSSEVKNYSYRGA